MSKRISYWILFTLTMAVYLVMVLWSLPMVAASAGGLVPFDLRPSGYSFAEAQAFLSALTPEGRAFYLNTQLRLDAAYPAMMAVVLALGGLALGRSSKRRTGNNVGRNVSWVIVVAAVAGAGFDYLENWAIASLLKTPIAALDAAPVSFASGATLAKSGLTTVAMGLILVLLVYAGVKRLQNRGAK